MLLLAMTMSTTGEKSENEVVACDIVPLDRETGREMTVFIAIALTEGRYLEFQGFFTLRKFAGLALKVNKILQIRKYRAQGQTNMLSKRVSSHRVG